MPWGADYKGGDTYIKATKPPDADGGLKMTKYAGEMTTDVKTGTPAAGAENICGAGQPYSSELQALFAGEL